MQLTCYAHMVAGFGRRRSIILTALIVLVWLPDASHAQIKRLLTAGRDETTRKMLASFMGGEDPITTSASDALIDVPFLDDYDPEDGFNLSHLPRGANGGFLVHRGLFELEAESFCLHAGTHAPGEGDGYLHAELAGPQAPVVRKILRNSFDHPDVTQREVQLLLWSILARARVEDLPPERRNAAVKLLPPEDLVTLNRNGLGLVPDDVMKLAQKELPDPARQAFEIEARMRSLLTDPASSFEEIEQAAVLFGDLADDDNSTPRERWSYHPDGYFVRYQPTGYSRTRLQMEFPAFHAIGRDGQHRIVTVSDEYGNRVEVEYDDDVTPVTVPGDPGMRAFVLRSVRFVTPDTSGPGESVVVDLADPEWTLVGSSPEKGTLRQSPAGFPGFTDRYAAVQRVQENVAELSERNTTGPESALALADVVDLAHLKMSIAASHAGDSKLVTRAWQYSLCRYLDGCGEAGANLRFSSAFGETRGNENSERSSAGTATTTGFGDANLGGPLGDDSFATSLSPFRSIGLSEELAQGGACGNEMDPSGAAAVPASSAKQRLGIGPRSADGESAGSVPAAVGLVTHREGGIRVRRDGKWVKAKKGDAIAVGETVQTVGRSRVEITLPDGSVVRMGPESEIQLPPTAHRCSSGREQSQPFSLKLMLGRAWWQVIKATGGDKKYEVTTGNTGGGVRGTTFLVEIQDDPAYVTFVGVCDGEVEVWNTLGSAQDTVLVTTGQMTRVVGDGVPEQPSAFNCTPNWMDWVQMGAPRFASSSGGSN